MLAIMGDEQAKSEDPDDVAMRDSSLMREQDTKNEEKEIRSSALMLDMQTRIASAQALGDLGLISVELSKTKTLMEPHRAVLRELYVARQKTLVNKVSPEVK